MERFRLKNIIILILVLLNGFLVSSLAQRRTAERDAFHRTAEQLAALFEEKENGGEAERLNFRKVALARDTALEERAAAFLLGDALSVSDQGGGIFHYAGPAGEAFFRSSGGFEAAGTLAQRDVEDFCRDFCRTFSYEAPDLRLDEEGSGGRLLRQLLHRLGRRRTRPDGRRSRLIPAGSVHIFPKARPVRPGFSPRLRKPGGSFGKILSKNTKGKVCIFPPPVR